jgi:hypothetical protein
MGAKRSYNNHTVLCGSDFPTHSAYVSPVLPVQYLNSSCPVLHIKVNFEMFYTE